MRTVTCRSAISSERDEVHYGIPVARRATAGSSNLSFRVVVGDHGPGSRRIEIVQQRRWQGVRGFMHAKEQTLKQLLDGEKQYVVPLISGRTHGSGPNSRRSGMI